MHSCKKNIAVLKNRQNIAVLKNRQIAAVSKNRQNWNVLNQTATICLKVMSSLYYVIAVLLFLLSAILFCFYAMLCGLFDFDICRRFYNATTDNSDEESGDN